MWKFWVGVWSFTVKLQPSTQLRGEGTLLRRACICLCACREGNLLWLTIFQQTKSRVAQQQVHHGNQGLPNVPHTLPVCALDGNRISSLFKIKLLCSDATIWKPKHLSTYRKLHHEAYRQISMWAADTQHAPIGCWCIFFTASGNLVSPFKEGPVSVSAEDGVAVKPLSWVETLLLGPLRL